MKVLTIQQPWVWAIFHAGKDIENRSWITHYRGPLVIHAGARFDSTASDDLPRGVHPPDRSELTYSALVGIVALDDDPLESSRSKWFRGKYGWVLKTPHLFTRPIPCKGRLGLWNLSPSQKRAVQRHLQQ